jgi:hypothetical protein
MKRSRDYDDLNAKRTENIDEYSEFIKLTDTENAYRGVPLATNANRGVIIENFIKSQIDGKSTSFVNWNGVKCGINSGSFDFLHNGMKYEVKSGQLCCRYTINPNPKKVWYLRFQNILEKHHDVLILAAYTPFGLYVYEYDGQKKLYTNGIVDKINGSKLVYVGCDENILNAWAIIQNKLKSMSIHSDHIKQFYPLTEIPETISETQKKYSTPLSHCSNKSRGIIIENIVKKYFKKHGHNVEECNELRGRHTVSYDFKLNGERVEVKSSQLAYHQKGWELTFKKIKNGLHDRLILVAYLP